eukprot:4086580-Amphidinium_carterae.1
MGTSLRTAAVRGASGALAMFPELPTMEPGSRESQRCENLGGAGVGSGSSAAIVMVFGPAFALRMCPCSTAPEYQKHT